MPGDGDMFNTFGTGAGVDLPLRAALVLVGAWQTVRWRTGRAVVVIGLIYLGLALVFVYLHAPLLNTIYAATFPWAQSFRLLMLVAIAPEPDSARWSGPIVLRRSRCCWARVSLRADAAEVSESRNLTMRR